jgi:hypothetical protein
MEPNFAGQWFGFLLAATIYRMNRPMRRYRTQLHKGQNHS